MPSTPSILPAVAAGLAAAALTDIVLAGLGDARIAGLQAGVAAAPLLALALLPAVRRTLAADGTRLLAAAGAAWTLAPFVDQHLTHAVVVDGSAADLFHHVAGWPALLAAASS